MGGLEIVFGRRHLHGRTEDLQTVAVGIEDVDAFGEDMVRRHLHLDPVVLELVIEFAQLGFPTLDLQRRVAQVRTAHWLVLRDLDHGDIVVPLPTGEEGHLELRIEWHQLHAEVFSVERDRGLRVAAAEDDVPDLGDLCHNILLERSGLTRHQATSHGDTRRSRNRVVPVLSAHPVDEAHVA